MFGSYESLRRDDADNIVQSRHWFERWFPSIEKAKTHADRKGWEVENLERRPGRHAIAIDAAIKNDYAPKLLEAAKGIQAIRDLSNAGVVAALHDLEVAGGPGVWEAFEALRRAIAEAEGGR